MNCMPWNSAMFLPNCLTLLDVGHGLVERALGDADGLGADRDAGVVEGAQGDLQALTASADHPVAGDAAVVEVQLTGRAALDAELALLLTEGEARVALLDDEGRDCCRRGARRGR
jgi:hypothetical protein